MKYIIYTILFLLTLSSCKKVVLKIEEVPSNTPLHDEIYVTGNFNYWDPGDDQFIMKLNPDSTYTIELPLVFGGIHYKFTRGNWSTVEKNRCGNELSDRIITSRTDTVYHVIESWADLDPVNCDSITIVVENIPKNTPANQEIKIAGSFNAWTPGTNDIYQLKTDTVQNKMMVTIPRQSPDGNVKPVLEYKFVRNESEIPEVDKFGREIGARELNFEKGDTVYVNIDNWADLVKPEDNMITVVLTNIPENTPPDDDIYLVGNFNNWNPADANYKFKRFNNSHYSISLPRKKYGLSFKITRGSWHTEFCSKCGDKLDNLNYNYDDIDTISLDIEGWLDLKPKRSKFVTLIIDSLPVNTPDEDDLFLRTFSHDFHYEVPKYKFNELPGNKYIYALPRRRINDRFIIMRDGFSSQQVDKNGHFIKYQTLDNLCEDTIYLKVENWNDINDFNKQTTTITVNKLPRTTATNIDLYIVGLFNGWNPGDEQYKLTKNQAGKYSIDIPTRYLYDGFKFTRGSWNTVEGSKTGEQISNRYLNETVNYLEITIKGWE